MRKIIGVLGWIGSGKGTVGDHLIDEHGFTQMSFASPLKDSASAIFGWPRHLLEGNTDESRLWREKPDSFWSQKLGHEVTPRWVLQQLGTEVLREHFQDDIWIWSMERALQNNDNSIVITDVRFPNEIKMIESLGGELWWVQRGKFPKWFDYCAVCPDQMKIKYPDLHESEYAWLNTNANLHIIDNNKDLQHLYYQIDRKIYEI